MRSRVFTATQKVTIGAYQVDVRDTSVTNLYLRRYTESGGVYTYAEEIAGISLGDGSFAFTFPDGNYQLWKSAHPDTNPLNCLVVFSGASDKYVALIDEVLPYVRKVTDISGTYWECESLEFRSAGVTTEANSLIRKSEADLRFATLTQITTLTDIINAKVGETGDWDLEGQLTFTKVPKMITPDNEDVGYLAPPTDDGHFIYLKYLNSVMPQIIQSNRVIRVVPDATVEVTGKLYKTILAASTYAGNQSPSVSKQYTILIESMGNNVEYISAGVNSLKPYVHLVGIGRHIKVVIEDNSKTGLNTNLENLTLIFGSGAISTDRSYTGLNFIGSNVFIYRNMELIDSQVQSCPKIVTSGSYRVAFDGVSEIYSNVFRNTYTKTSTPIDAGNSIVEDMVVMTDPTIIT